MLAIFLPVLLLWRRVQVRICDAALFLEGFHGSQDMQKSIIVYALIRVGGMEMID